MAGVPGSYSSGLAQCTERPATQTSLLCLAIRAKHHFLGTQLNSQQKRVTPDLCRDEKATTESCVVWQHCITMLYPYHVNTFVREKYIDDSMSFSLFKKHILIWQSRFKQTTTYEDLTCAIYSLCNMWIVKSGSTFLARML